MIPACRLLLLPTFALLAPSDAAAQAGPGFSVELERMDGRHPNSEFGRALAFIGDVTGDGHDELVVEFVPAGGDRGPALRAIDTATRAKLWELRGAAPFRCDDLDGDGVEDVGYLSRDGSGITLSSATGTQLLQVSLPGGSEQAVHAESCDDRDGDGIRDVLLLSQDPSAATAWVRVVSSSTGAILHVLPSACHVPASPGRRVVSARFLGDVDGDGIGDFAFADLLAPWSGIDGAGVVYIRSGADGSVLHLLGGWLIHQEFGHDLDLVGDLDDDGVGDLLARGRSWGGRVQSPRSGQVLLDLQAAGSGFLPGGAAPVSDFDGDGVPDLLIGAIVYSGADGELLTYIQIPGLAPNTWLGVAVAPIESTADDRDFLMSAPWTAPGSVHAVAIEPGIRAARRIMRVSQPSQLELELRFPATEAGRHFRVLASLGPAGVHTVGNVTIPLAWDPVFASTAARAPGWLTGGSGRVPDTLAASATVSAPAATLFPLLGRTMRFAVVTGAAGLPTWTSVSVPVTVLP